MSFSMCLFLLLFFGATVISKFASQNVGKFRILSQIFEISQVKFSLKFANDLFSFLWQLNKSCFSCLSHVYTQIVGVGALCLFRSLAYQFSILVCNVYSLLVSYLCSQFVAMIVELYVSLSSSFHKNIVRLLSSAL